MKQYIELIERGMGITYKIKSNGDIYRCMEKGSDFIKWDSTCVIGVNIHHTGKPIEYLTLREFMEKYNSADDYKSLYKKNGKGICKLVLVKNDLYLIDNFGNDIYWTV